jgi:phosphinothricin acetyltransferase
MPGRRPAAAVERADRLRRLADGPAAGMRIRAATPDDAAAIAHTYAPYVEGSVVSFEVEAPGVDEMAARMAAGASLYPWLVAESGDAGIAGYAYACAFRTRPAYRFAVETTIYLNGDAQGRGVGRRLYFMLLELLRAQGFAQAIAAITLPNDASVMLHERLGFGHAGTYRQVGYKLGAWWDVGLWQCPLAPVADPPAEPLPLAAVALPAGISPAG